MKPSFEHPVGPLITDIDEFMKETKKMLKKAKDIETVNKVAEEDNLANLEKILNDIGETQEVKNKKIEP